MNAEVLASLFRQVLVIAGTWFTAKGVVNESNWELLSGAVVTVSTTGYMLWTRWNTVKVPDPKK